MWFGEEGREGGKMASYLHRQLTPGTAASGNRGQQHDCEYHQMWVCPVEYRPITSQES